MAGRFPEWKIVRTPDFVPGSPDAEVHWRTAVALPLKPVWDAPLSYKTEGRILYSETGLYVRADCEDRKLTATLQKDNEDLFNEDVIEVFIWPEESRRVYFEYEISPLGFELPLIIPNPHGRFMGWLPWHYEGDRKVKRFVRVHGGTATPGAAVTGWTTEFFIPFALLLGIMDAAPSAGTRWRANFYRIDYDDGKKTHWAWAPLSIRTFHAPDEFGVLVFT